MVVDGMAFANHIYHNEVTQGMFDSHNPLHLYESAMNYINMLKGLNLRVIRVYIDAITNIDKLDTYLSRRKQNQKEIDYFWENSLTSKRSMMLLLAIN